jgi:hypothetical protein
LRPRNSTHCCSRVLRARSDELRAWHPRAIAVRLDSSPVSADAREREWIKMDLDRLRSFPAMLPPVYRGHGSRNLAGHQAGGVAARFDFLRRCVVGIRINFAGCLLISGSVGTSNWLRSDVGDSPRQTTTTSECRYPWLRLSDLSLTPITNCTTFCDTVRTHPLDGLAQARVLATRP